MGSKKKRVQFDFSPEAYEQLEQLQADTHAGTKAEVVRKALSLLAFVLQAEEDGETLLIQPKNSKELQRLKLL